MSNHRQGEAPGRKHPLLPKIEEQLQSGACDRREFLRTAVLLGVSIPAAYSMAGKILGEDLAPQALAQEPQRGGVLRVGMAVMEVGDPAIIDWTEKGNLLRMSLESLVRIGTDNLAGRRTTTSPVGLLTCARASNGRTAMTSLPTT